VADVVGGHEGEPSAQDVGEQLPAGGPRGVQPIAADHGVLDEAVDREARLPAGGVPDARDPPAAQRALPARASSRQPQPPAGLCTVRSAM
jgi:hypothetical protein